MTTLASGNPVKLACRTGLGWHQLIVVALSKVLQMKETSDRAGVLVRQMIPQDLPAVVDLQRRTYLEKLAWTAEELTQHLAIFPEGQFVAVDEAGRLLGSASSLIIDWDDYAESAKWSAITGRGTFDTHNPLGKTLYGADMCVDPLIRRKGVGSFLYEARKKMVRERGLKRLLTGGRIPGYSQVAGKMTPQDYVAEVVKGTRKDPTLSFQLANGLVVLDVVPEYLEDSESRGFATLLEWLNPEYMASVSLESGGLQTDSEELREEISRELPRPRRVRIAAMQYLLRPITRFEEFATQVEFFVRSAQEYRSQFVLFPEYFTMQLLSSMREPAPARAVRRLAQLAPNYEALFKRLATESGSLHHCGNASRDPGRQAVQCRTPVHAERSSVSPEESASDFDGKGTIPNEPGPWVLCVPHGLRQDCNTCLLRRGVPRSGPSVGGSWSSDSFRSLLHGRPPGILPSSVLRPSPGKRESDLRCDGGYCGQSSRGALHGHSLWPSSDPDAVGLFLRPRRDRGRRHRQPRADGRL